MARATFAAAGSPLAGYWAGGEYPAPNTHTSQTDKCTYSVDTTALTPFAALSQSKFGLLATGGPTAAYFSQGYSPSISSVSTTDKLIYSTDTRLTVPGSYSTYSSNDGKGGIGKVAEAKIEAKASLLKQYDSLIEDYEKNKDKYQLAPVFTMRWHGTTSTIAFFAQALPAALTAAAEPARSANSE